MLLVLLTIFFYLYKLLIYVVRFVLIQKQSQMGMWLTLCWPFELGEKFYTRENVFV